MATTSTENLSLSSLLETAKQTQQQPRNTGCSPCQVDEDGLTKVLKHGWKFDTFGDRELFDMGCACIAFMRQIQHQEPPRMLSLIGKSGVGKSHLAEAIFKHCGIVDAGWLDWRSFTSRLKSGAFDICEAIEHRGKQSLLVLDDVGADYDKSGFGVSLLDQLINARKSRWTVLTSNLYLHEIAAIEARIADRLKRYGSKVVEIRNAKSYVNR